MSQSPNNCPENISSSHRQAKMARYRSGTTLRRRVGEAGVDEVGRPQRSRLKPRLVKCQAVALPSGNNASWRARASGSLSSAGTRHPVARSVRVSHPAPQPDRLRCREVGSTHEGVDQGMTGRSVPLDLS